MNPTTTYNDYVSFVDLVSKDGELSCYQEAIKGSESVKRKKDMREEMDVLGRNTTWDLVELPYYMNIFDCKQV